MAKGNSKKRQSGRQSGGRQSGRYTRNASEFDINEFVPPVKVDTTSTEEQEERTKRALALLQASEQAEREIIHNLATLKIEKIFWGRLSPEVLNNVNDFSTGSFESDGNIIELTPFTLLKTKLHRALNNRYRALNMIIKELLLGKNINKIVDEKSSQIEAMKNNEPTSEIAEGEEETPVERSKEQIREYNNIRNIKFLAEMISVFCERTSISDVIGSLRVINIIEGCAMKAFNIIDETSAKGGNIGNIVESVEEEAKNYSRVFMKNLDRLNSILEQKGEERIHFF